MSHWRQLNYREDKMPEQLRPVDCPACVLYIWGYFLDMGQRRTSNGFGYNPIPDDQLMAWARRRRIALLPFEHRLLDRLESVFLRIKNRDKKKDGQ